MRYIIYKTIDEESFQKLHKRIAILQVPFEEILSRYGFKITSESDLVEILGLDFISYGDRYDGNIGFLFDDEEFGHLTFTFYVKKSFDNNKKRYSKRETILEKVDLEYIEDNYPDLLSKAVRLYENMKDEDMTNITILK